jgi:hypothetical protein
LVEGTSPTSSSEPPPRIFAQAAGLRIKSFIGIIFLFEPGFGAKEPPRLVSAIKRGFELGALYDQMGLVATCLVVPTLGAPLTK